ncbi:MAG: LD-carboxypeptidase [Paludibacteraceae bacterium]|nr:LD-carboxypeptidase [Paludibacteraceae bacterium]
MIKHIRIVSPSGVMDPQLIDQAAERLHSWGFEVSEGIHTRDVHGRFAGTDEARLADLTDAISDSSIDLILCSRGGYGMQRIIDRVPAITKPILGFSDITALHQLAGLNHQPSLHGVMCKHIATLPEDGEVLKALRAALGGEVLNYSLPSHPLNRLGEVSGPIIGGNLSVLYGLQGTSYDLLSLKDIKPILFIEDIGERHYHIDRMMHNLRMSGVLQQIGGLIVGQFTDCDDDPLMPARTVQQTIYEAVAAYNYPVVFDFPCGHVERNLPIWLHHPATLSVTHDQTRLTISSPL